MILTLTDVYGRPLWQDGKLIPPQILVRTREKFETMFMRGRFGLKKFQRGILQIAASGTMIPTAGGAVTISVSNIIISDSVSSGQVHAAIVFNETTVGSVSTLVKRHTASFILMGDDDAGSPVDHTGEWTTDGPAAADFEVSCTSEDVGTWNFPFASVGVYSDFTNSDMAWRETRTGGKGYTPGTDTCTGTFRIREVADPGGNFDDFTVQASAIQT